MARRESPASHLAAIAAVATVSLVLVQTISERVPSSSGSFAMRPAEVSCDRAITVDGSGYKGSAHLQSSRSGTALPVRANCFQRSRITGERFDKG